MRRVLTLIMITSLILTGSVAEDDGSFMPEEPDNVQDSRATCGDGVCDDVEKNVCPEDCGGPGLQTNNTDDSGRTDTTAEGANSPLTPAIIGAGVFLIALLIGGIILYMSIIPEEDTRQIEPDRDADTYPPER